MNGSARRLFVLLDHRRGVVLLGHQGTFAVFASDHRFLLMKPELGILLRAVPDFWKPVLVFWMDFEAALNNFIFASVHVCMTPPTLADESQTWIPLAASSSLLETFLVFWMVFVRLGTAG